MLPAAALLLVFLTYPLGLGTWLGFTDTKIGRAGSWVGLDNFKYLWGDSVTRLSLFNTLFYTVVASVIKFALGLWLAILLNRTCRSSRSCARSCCCRSSCRPRCRRSRSGGSTTRSSRSSAGRSSEMGLIDHATSTSSATPGTRASRRSRPTSGAACRSSRSACWRGCRRSRPRSTRRRRSTARTAWQRFRYVTLPLLTPIIAVVMTFSVLFTFTDFQLIYVLTRGGPLNATHLMATLSFQRAISGGSARARARRSRRP